MGNVILCAVSGVLITPYLLVQLILTGGDYDLLGKWEWCTTEVFGDKPDVAAGGRQRFLRADDYPGAALLGRSSTGMRSLDWIKPITAAAEGDDKEE
jgi:hypothetical protein